MSLNPGDRIGPYEIDSRLGAGGMGEIYRARDPRLGRDVAIKGLPAALNADSDRLARFEREARLLAALNHPNIGILYGLEVSHGSPYLVLELVEGETLKKRLERGALGVRETLDICGQIAGGIEAAHDRGIVHRDLKPENVMLTPSGTVKVLDFGLAKGDATESGATAGSGPGSSLAPTLAISATAAGLILGTAPYMSPEQARGAAVDRRTDVWALGCILVECLSGHQVFDGQTVSDVIARILEREPDWGALPSSVPPRLRDLARRCLTKDPADRPRDIGDIRREMAAIARDLASGSPGSGIAGSASPSLAVLYFENLSADKESEYFCAGITEDILTDLSKIAGMRVASRNAVARYRGTQVDVARVGADLGVSAVLEGSVRRAGDRIRISAQLISAADGFHLWAERYDRTLQDVFTVQEEIASSIASALRVKLTASESRQLVQNRPADARAYDLYLKGRESYGHYTADSIRHALQLFREAIEVDAEYALAWAGTADCYGQMVQWDAGGEKGENIRLGVEAADRACAINPELPEALKAKALLLRIAGRRDEALQALRKAIELNPKFTPALLNLGVESYSSGDLAGAERYVRRTLEVDPREPFAVSWLCMQTHLSGRFRESAELARHLRQLSDDPFYVIAHHSMLVWDRLAQGDLDGAGHSLAEARKDEDRTGNLDGLEALIAVRSGRTEEARRLLASCEGRRTLLAGSLMSAAGAALRLGEGDVAIRLMTREIVRELGPVLVRLDPELHPLLDRAPFSPRRSALSLVWPLQSPMIDPARHGLFHEVRIESAVPRPGGVLP